jgi:hypothetical protein
MSALTAEATQVLRELAQRYGVSLDAVTSLLFAVSSGGGSMAQFNHPELGGSGQWMQGGMTMVSDMWNHALQGKVSGLCGELSNLLRAQNVFAAPAPGSSSEAGAQFAHGGGNWWPAGLGSPASSGGQNDMRYAYFPHAQRLAILRDGQLALYDTLDHQIAGVQQQQAGGGHASLSFSSQRGTFTVESLPQVNRPQAAQAEAPVAVANVAPQQAASRETKPARRSADEVLTALERLGELRQKGILSEDEFQAKKVELLNRL